MEGRTPAYSYTEQVHLVNSADLNGYKRLFGGVLLSWLDVVAATVARRHTHSNVTTASIDSLRFVAPAHANDLVVLCGKVTHTGRTSLEVCVRTFVESIDGTRTLINEAYFVMVALDENEKPTEVPPVLPQTEEERRDYEAGARRREERKRK